LVAVSASIIAELGPIEVVLSHDQLDELVDDVFWPASPRCAPFQL
jgi:hypothetical protein